MLKDTAFIADAERRGFEFVPTSYDKVESFYKHVISDASPEVVTMLQSLFP
jgi:hypothetical protein